MYIFVVMKKILLSILAFLWVSLPLHAQKRLTEATIYYDFVVNTKNPTPGAADMLDGATSVVYLKGSRSRADFVNSLGTQTTIYDTKSGVATNLVEYGNQRFMITFTPAEWKTSNKKYENISYTIQDEFKTIAGYRCQKAVAKLDDGTTVVAYFTKDLQPVSTEFSYINKNLPGLVMEYEASQDKARVVYTVSNIDFGVVPLAKFDLPKTGFRVLSYTESLKAGK